MVYITQYATEIKDYTVTWRNYDGTILEIDEKKEFTLFVLNQYYVLLTRGIDGIQLGFWDNDDFRKHMENTLGI